MANLILHAPLAGWAMPLDEVPDPVFAQRMAGDGIAIDPTGDLLHAPCDGRIFPMPGSSHALTLRTAEGIDILLHLGIETVALAGAGFELLVKAGAQVCRGQPLLRFDLDLIAMRARSAITPILVVSGGRLVVAADSCRGRSIAVGDPLMEVQADHSTATVVAAAATDTRVFVRRGLRAGFDHGIHARPAALIAAALKPYAAKLSLHAHGRAANARSAVSLMALGVQHNEAVELQASGSDAEAALTAVAALLIADEQAPPAQDSVVEVRVPLPAMLSALIAHRGLALGRAIQLQQTLPAFAEYASDPAEQGRALDDALLKVSAHLESLMQTQRGEQVAILRAHGELLQDPELRDEATQWIAQGRSAAWAWQRAITTARTALAAVADPHIRDRIADLQDLERQVLRVLAGQPASDGIALPEAAILLADELLPSQLMALDRSRIAGLCSARGGPTSHVAIIAAALGIPALVAAGAQVLQIADGAELLLDAERGQLLIAPDEAARQRARRAISEQRVRHAEDLAAAAASSATRDRVAIRVYANLGSIADATVAVGRGAEGCGLLRSEFLFLERQQPPDEEEQRSEYQAILDAMGSRPLTIRTLDIGGDKPIPYLPLPHEDNPALGLRGLRTSLAWPELLKTQLRAILGLQPLNQVRLLLPMVTEVDEIRSVRAMINTCRGELGISATPRLGVMIETPASAVLADQLLAEVDFLSIGTNDLSQYVLAMDRTHARLAARLDALHPSVLRLIAQVARSADERGVELAVCGGLASDPDAIALLIGLGVREISAVPTAIPELKRVIRSLHSGACVELAQQALKLGSARAVRERAIASRLEVSGA
jgi:multiphosphoryl transfer protein